MEALYDAVNYFVLNGHNVQIPNLGTFSLGVHAKSAASEVEFSANFAKNLKRIILRFLPDTELKAMLSSTATSTHVDSTGFKGNGVVAVTSAYSDAKANIRSRYTPTRRSGCTSTCSVAVMRPSSGWSHR